MGHDFTNRFHFLFSILLQTFMSPKKLSEVPGKRLEMDFIWCKQMQIWGGWEKSETSFYPQTATKEVLLWQPIRECSRKECSGACKCPVPGVLQSRSSCSYSGQPHQWGECSHTTCSMHPNAPNSRAELLWWENPVPNGCLSGLWISPTVALGH